MSNYNDAIYAATRLDRGEIFGRVSRVLHACGARFLGMARGLEWDESLGCFGYVLGQDLEGLDTTRETLIVARDWPRVCMDFDIRALGMAFEVHVFSGQPPLQDTQSVAISCPEIFFRVAREDPARAEVMLSLLQDVGLAIDSAPMACGAALDSKAYGAAELEQVFEKHLRSRVTPDDNAMHTVLFDASVLSRLAGLPGCPAYAQRVVEGGYTMATLLLGG
jgi:hypothetical protein